MALLILDRCFADNDALPLSEQFLNSLGYNELSLAECLCLQAVFIAVFGLMVLAAVEFVSFEVR
jgi:hypothetical protein